MENENRYHIQIVIKRFNEILKSVIEDNFEKKALELDFKPDTLAIILTNSILSGEIYYIIGDDTSTEKGNVIKYFPYLKDQLRGALIETTFSNPVRELLDKYSKLIDYFSKYIKMVESSIGDMLTPNNIFAHFVVEPSISVQEIENYLLIPQRQRSDSFLLFFVTLKLAEYDESLEASEEQALELKRFLNILTPMTEGRNGSFVSAKELCEYLIYKIDIRERNVYRKGIEHTKADRIVQSLKFHDYGKGKYSAKDCCNSIVIKELGKRTGLHYEDKLPTDIVELATSTIKKYLENEKFQITNNAFEDITSTIRLCHFHVLNKNVSLQLRRIEQTQDDIVDLTSEEKNLGTWIDLLERQLKILNDNNGNRIDRLAFTSVITLLVNNRFRIILAREKLDDKFGHIIEDLSSDNKKDWLKTLNEFRKNLAFDTVLNSGIHDYHGYKYFLNFLDSLFTHIRKNTLCLFKDSDTINEENFLKINKINNDKFNDLKVYYSELLHIYDLKLKMYSIRKHKPVYLTFMECVGDLKGEKKVSDIFSENCVDNSAPILFIDSSYILPEDFSIAKDDLRGKETYLTSNIRSLKNRVEIDVKGKLNDTIFKKKTEDFEKKIKENEFKVIQIVALFVTVAVFVLNSAKFFVETDDLDGYFAIMFGLAACLVLFNAVFKWLVAWEIHKPILPQESVIDKSLKMIIRHGTSKSLEAITILLFFGVSLLISVFGENFPLFSAHFWESYWLNILFIMITAGIIFRILHLYQKKYIKQSSANKDEFLGGLYDIYMKFVFKNLTRSEVLVTRILATILDPLMIFIVLFMGLAFYYSQNHYMDKEKKQVRLDSLNNNKFNYIIKVKIDSMLKAHDEKKPIGEEKKKPEEKKTEEKKEGKGN
jgi:hypothetical protein